jgi:hypothetical protein
LKGKKRRAEAYIFRPATSSRVLLDAHSEAGIV